MGNIFTQKDLHIYRGTYEECMAQPTADMTIYLAWDTYQIFIGNTAGRKVPYGTSKAVFLKLDKKVEELTGVVLSQAELKARETVEAEIEEKGILNENSDLILGIINRLTDNEQAIEALNNAANNIYTKTEVDNKIDEFGNSLPLQELTQLSELANDQVIIKDTSGNISGRDFTQNAQTNRVSIMMRNPQGYSRVKFPSDSELTTISNYGDLIVNSNRLNSELAKKQDLLGYTAEKVSNKVTTIGSNSNSNSQYASVNAIKSFVNSSIQTSTAEFRGNFGTYALLLAYTGDKHNHDYAVVVNDENNNGQTSRYKYNGTSWEYEYKVNDTPLTSAQLSAINSGIDESLVSTYNGHLNNTDIHVTAEDKENWNGKQSAISDLDDIRSGAALGATALQAIPDTYALKTEVDTKLDKYTTASGSIRIYGVNGSGAQTMLYGLDDTNQGTVPVRSTNGCVATGTPVRDADAVNKAYLDNWIHMVVQ